MVSVTDADHYSALVEQARGENPASPPLIRPGLVYVNLGRLNVVLLGRDFDEGAYDAFVSAYRTTLDELTRKPAGFKTFAYMQIGENPWWKALPMLERVKRLQVIGEIGKKYDTAQANHIAFGVNYVHSLIARTVQRTVLQISRLRYPTSTVASSRDAWRVLGAQLPGDELAAMRAAYRHVVVSFVPDLDP